MSDLLICLNLKDTIINGCIVLETYLVHKIRKLKNRQFSGVLSKCDINEIKFTENISSDVVNTINNLFHQPNNIQINSYQHLINNQNKAIVNNLIPLGCVYFKEPKGHLFELDHIEFNFSQEKNSFKIKGNNLELFLIHKKSCTKNTEFSSFIAKNLYLTFNSDEVTAELCFEYNNKEINYADIKNRRIVVNNHDYYQEQLSLKQLKQNKWEYTAGGVFTFNGEDLSDSLTKLKDSEFNLFLLKDKKKVTVGNFSVSSISYNIDWFELHGNIKFEDEVIDLQLLSSLKSNKNQWIEINDKIVVLPNNYLRNQEILDNTEKDKTIIEKKYLGNVLALADDVGITSIKNVEAITSYEDIPLNIEKKLFKVLKPFQIIGTRWLLYLFKNNFGGCLADDMGLGKTLQVIAYLSDKRFDGTCNLVIVPKTLIGNWKKEFNKFSPNLNYYTYHSTTRNINNAFNSKVILTTYGMIINDFNNLVSKEFANVIIDEAQYIKNSRTNSYKKIFALKANTKIILTGTPFENNFNEIIGLMNLANPHIFNIKLKSLKTSNQLDSNNIRHVKRIISPFILRRMKEDVLTELPTKDIKTIYCSMDSDQRKLYNYILGNIQYEIKRKPGSYEIKSNTILLQGLLCLQQICCHPKLLAREINPFHCLDSCKTEVFLAMIKELTANKHKVVVFSRFTKMLTILRLIIDKENIKSFYLDGKTKNRMKEIEDFEDSNEGVFLVSLKAGGVGLTLTSADTVIMYDPWWNPAVEQQAEDRVYRIGQKNNVTIFRLVVENTIEEKVEDLKNKKSEIASMLLENENIISSLNLNDLRKLLIN